MSKVIDQLLAAMNAHDLDAVIALIHDDYTSVQPAHPDREFGSSAQVRANWGAMFAGIPDFRAELVRSVDDGQTCWTEWHWSGNRTDGENLDMRGVALFDIRDGQIMAGRLYMEHVEQGGSGIAQSVIEESGLPPQTTA
jgi:ketosteroid isomerase-like protein